MALTLKKYNMTWKDVIHYAQNGTPNPPEKINKTAQEWAEILDAEVYYITRGKGTERPGSGDYCSSHEPGRYHCACCDAPLFDAELKYESHSGWPSFTKPVDLDAIGYVKDTSHGMIRVEVVCNRCDAHLGHVFPDGPEPTGLRYCINSLSLIHQIKENV
jgi:methionine-R-sulfoxide reductase